MSDNITPTTGEIVDISGAPAQTGSIYNRISDPIEAIKVMGEMIAGSGMFGCQKVEQGMVLAMQCLAEGKAPLELAKTYHIVEGKLSMRADAMLGRFLTTGGKVKWLERSNERVSASWTHGCNEDVVISVTLDEMRKNGVAMDKTGRNLKVNWERFPRQMLTARVISEAVRLLAPQIVAGIYTPEEVQDFTDKPSPAPAPVRVAIAPPKASVVEPIVDAKAALKQRLDELLAAYEPRASQELISWGYIKDGQTYADLDAMSAERLLNNPAKFLARINDTNAS